MRHRGVGDLIERRRLAECTIERVDVKGWKYLFSSRWDVPASIDELREMVFDPLSLTDWWPSVFLDLRLIQWGGEHAVGTRAIFRSKGWMPHVITLDAHIVAGGMDPPRLRIEVAGDLCGYAEVRARESGRSTFIDVEWCIDLEKRSIRYLAFAIWPLLVSNHKWVMARGYESLLLELRRRRCSSERERGMVPPPPGPVFPHHNNRPRSTLQTLVPTE